ncbi:MAG: putative glycoside hydrolase [Patescibacteria group bacterium]
MYKSIKIKLSKYLAIVLLLAIFFSVAPASPARAANKYPRLANFYLYSPIRESEVAQFSKWDVLIFHMLATQNSAAQIKKIRQLNPDIKILVYLASQEFPIEDYKSWDTMSNGLMKQEVAGITDDMWLLDEDGDHVVFWGSNWMLNITSDRWTNYLSSFVVDKLLSSGLYDGVFYDNSWYNVSWVNGGAIDADKDGRNDNADKLNAAWRAGMNRLYQETRAKAGKQIMIIGNGDQGYYGDINGIYFENFSTNSYISWEEKMRLYNLSQKTSVAPQAAIIGNTSADSSKAKTDYQKMRFGLTSALLSDGYYAYDAGSYSHAERWWYDEYDVNLGEALSPAVSQSGNTAYTKDVWKREFTNGIAVVNSLAEKKEVDLGGEFEKIIGTQDPKTNDGGIVSKINVAAKDGLLLLKTYQTVKDLVFVNGSFVRFFDMLGNRVRNGFFAYDERYAGGARVLFANVDGVEGDETIVASGAKLEIFNSKGEHLFNDYPYGANYKGDIRISIGRLFKDQIQDQILVSPSFGGSVIMYNYYGAAMQAGYSPFAKSYVGGLSIAAAQLNGDNNDGNVIVGVGKGKKAEVLIYDNRLNKLISRFYPYDKTFKGGIFVSAGDVNGDGKDEIIVGALSSTKIPVRVFNASGKKLSEFTLTGVFGASGGNMVGTVDINFDGKTDIAVINP